MTASIKSSGGRLIGLDGGVAEKPAGWLVGWLTGWLVDRLVD